jgi:hypothetical protein
LGPENKNVRGAMPALPNVKEEAKSEVKTSSDSSLVVGPIQVVATRAGFYGLVRRVEGDKFSIDNEKQLGDWMKKI